MENTEKTLQEAENTTKRAIPSPTENAFEFPLTDDEVKEIMYQHIKIKEMQDFWAEHTTAKDNLDEFLGSAVNFIKGIAIEGTNGMIAHGGILSKDPVKMRAEIIDGVHQIAPQVFKMLNIPCIPYTPPIETPAKLDMHGYKTKAPRYPRPNDIVTIPAWKSTLLALQGVLSINGEPIEFDEEQYRLVGAVKMALARCDEDGYTDHIIPTEGIAKYFKGGDGNTSLGEMEKSRIEDLMAYFHTLHGYDPRTQTHFQIIHFDYVENVNINGQLTTGYKIYHVIDIPHTLDIKYSQFALPKGYANSPENFKIWSTIINSSGNVDFEDLCKSLRVSKQNKKRRHDIKEKVITMIRLYELQDSVKMLMTSKTGEKKPLEID